MNGSAVPSLNRKPEPCESCDRWHLRTMSCDWQPPTFSGPVPADHPLRAKREPITYVPFHCSDCNHPWTIAALEGEPPTDHDVCRDCGGKGKRV